MKLPGLVLCAILAFHALHAQQPTFSSLAQLKDTLELRQSKSLSKTESFRLRNPTLPEYSADGTHTLLVDVDRFGMPVYRMTLNAGAAKSTGVDQLQNPALSGMNLTGTGITIGVWDGGTVKNHIEFGNRLVSTEGDTYNSHATHVTGTLIAQGLNPLARGMAPDAMATTYYFNNDLPVMSALAANGQKTLLISNHSYGTGTGWVRTGGGWNWTGNAAISSVEDYRFGLYTERAMMLDQVAFLAPYYSIFWAAGNDRSDTGDGSRPADCNAGTGYDCIIPDAVAKNILTIGAVNKVPSYTSPASVVMGTYSSWGPTDDGRIKPDLVAAGTDLFSLSATGVNTYEVMGGTSMATPNASGSLSLIQQLYRDLHGGNYMKAATLKALAIHTAREAGPFVGPDYSFGWGLVDAASAAQLLMSENNTDKIIRELSLMNGSRIEIPIVPLAGKKLTVTIVWTDPAGNPIPEALDPTTPALVNDLDLRIVDDAGLEQKPWVLDPLNPVRQAFRGDNFRDNVEKIEFNTPENKPYRIVVSHKGSLRNDRQDFSIIVSFQSTASPATYYWIGNSGQWNSGSHWSASTGGPAANKIPGPNDRVIFDENSFTVPNAQVLLTSGVTCSALVWNNSGNAQINLSSNALEITQELRARSANNLFLNGQVKLKSTSTGTVALQLDNSAETHLEISTGIWDWFGNSRVGNLAVRSALKLNEARLSVSNLTYTAGDAAAIDMKSSVLEVRGKASLPKGLSLSGPDSELTIRSIVELHLIDALNFDGTLNIQGVANITGVSNIRRLLVSGRCTIFNDGKFSLLELEEGAEISFNGTTMHHLDSISIKSSQAKRTKLRSTGKAFLFFDKFNRYCFDYLDVESIVLSATINAGLHSTVATSTGWQTVPCAEMAYADFTWDYACENSLVSFKDLSTGSPERWDWSMTGGSFVTKQGERSSLTDQNPYYVFPASGNYPVQLTIIKGNEGISQSKKNVVVMKNYLDPNEIIPDARVLLSKSSGIRYQWLRDGEVISGATSRTFEFNGVPGAYQVAAYGDACNALSSAFVVTGLESLPGGHVSISPNPAHAELFVEGASESAQVLLINALGAATELTPIGPGRYSVRSFSNGLYIVRILDEGMIHTRKILIER